jgi:hypothetical protein
MAGLKFSQQRKSLLSSQTRIQVPWVKVTLGTYTFGIFDSKTKAKGSKDKNGFYTTYNIKYPNYIDSLTVTKINGQVNQYVLNIIYPITQFDDPNFFEKVFSSIGNTRKIIFSYGGASVPSYTYKNEEAIITKITQSFNLERSSISYQVEAVSGAALTADGTITELASGAPVKPSEKIKSLFRSNKSLQDTFTGMRASDLDKLIAGDDQPVVLDSKRNISALDYIAYLASCMIPSGTKPGLSKDIYILTVHDDTILDTTYNPDSFGGKGGPYFKVTKTSYAAEHSDAYEVDIGYNTSTIVREFRIDQNENFSLYYDYQGDIHSEEYVRRLNKQGEWETVYSPTYMVRANEFNATAKDTVWWTKATKYPITATITIQGLLRPATLMQYLRLNIIFPGGHEHLASGLYIVTKQIDSINSQGYTTQLTLTRIGGDNEKQNS